MNEREEDAYVHNPADPYLLFNGPVYDTTPRELIPFIDTIRRESEWKMVKLLKCIRMISMDPVVSYVARPLMDVQSISIAVLQLVR